MQTNEQVVVIQGDASKWYSQVVFIMNPATHPNKIPMDFVAEAENIIHNYMAKKNGCHSDSIRDYVDYSTPISIFPVIEDEVKVKKRRVFRFDFIFYALMVLACIAMVAVVSAGWLR